MMLRLTLLIFALVWGILVLSAHADADRFDQEEAALWNLINDYREANGAQPVGLNDELMAAAAWMSEDMATNDYFSHTDSLGRSAKERMAAFGYIHNTMTGENLATGVANAQEAFDLLRASPKHNANMLSKYFWAIGIARFDGYWTIDFGGQGPAWLPPTPTPTPAPTSVPTPVPTLTPALPISPYESPHGDEAPSPPTPAAFPSTGGKP